MKTKVLMLGPARSVNGGISAVVNNYYEAGLDKKVDLTYLGTMEDGSKFHKLWIALKAVMQFLIIAPGYDIIHVNMASDVSLYRKMIFIQIAALYKKRIIIHQHGGNIREFFYEQCDDRKRAVIRSVLGKAERMLVVAPYLKDIFADIVEKDKIVVLPNSIQVPENVEKDYQTKRLLFLGRLCREKGIDELLDAAVELKRKYPDLELYFGGVWVDEDLHQKADKCGSWVHQLGWIGGNEKVELLKKCNIFVLPSYFEGLPVSLLEGMAYGCACIGTDVGGIPQTMEDQKQGILIPAKNTDELIDAVERYIKDVSLQERLGWAAHQRIADEFNIEKSIQFLEELYGIDD